MAPDLTSTHSNNLQTRSLLSNLASPANAIINPLNPTQGYGRLRHFNRMKREQFLRDAHPPLSVYWDEVDLSSLIDVLESCGSGPLYRVQRQTPVVQQTSIPPPTGQVSFRENNFGNQQQQERRFDPRAPHFDVILVDLTNTIFNAAPGIVHQGIASPGYETNNNSPEDRAKCSYIRNDMNTLPMESLAGRPGWVFVWVGPTEGLVEGRRILGSWGFRKVECIGWMKTNGGWDRVQNDEYPITTDDPAKVTGSCMGILKNAVEWCIMGCKGSAKRTFDSHLIHCNANTDVIISDGPDAPISSLLSHIIENFSLGQRRLHLFARAGDERPGWVTVGRGMNRTNFDCKRYLRTWGESGRQGWLTPFDQEIEYFRPKTPPLQVRRRERASKYKKSNHDNNGKGKYEAEPPRFPHLGQKKRPIWQPMTPEMQKVYAPYSHMDKTNILFSIDEGVTTFDLSAQGRLLEYGTTQKPLMGSRASQPPRLASIYQSQQEHQNGRDSTQSQPTLPVQGHPPQKLVEPEAIHTSLEKMQLQAQRPYLPAPFIPEQMTPQSRQVESITQGFCPNSDGRLMSQSLRNIQSFPPLSLSTSSGPSIDTSLPLSGQSGHTSNGNGSHQLQSELPSDSIYTYTRPVKTQPEFVPGRYRSTLAAPLGIANGIDNLHSTQQQARSWAGQANKGSAGAGRQFPLRPPGLSNALTSLWSPSGGQAKHENSSNQSQPSPYSRILPTHTIDQYHMSGHLPPPPPPPNSNAGYCSSQNQPGLFGEFKGLGGPTSMTQTSGPGYNYNTSNVNNNTHTHERYRQNFSPRPPANGHGTYAGTYVAPRPQDYVRGENGEFIVDHPPRYQQQLYLSGGNEMFRVEQRQQKNTIQDPALIEHQAQFRSQMMARAQSSADRTQNYR